MALVTKAPMPNWLQNALLAIKSAFIFGGAVALYLTHKIPLSTFTGVLSGFGGLWAGVGGVLISTGRTVAATPPAGAVTVPGASPTPVDSAAPSSTPVPPVVSHDPRTEP